MPFLFVPVVFVVVIFTASFFYCRTKILGIAGPLGAQISFWNKGYGTWEGVAYEFFYRPGGRHEQPSLEIRLPHVFPGEFTVFQETEVDKFFQKIKLARDLQTGDPCFDEKFLIETNVEEPVRQYFMQEAKRRAVERIFGQGVVQIEHTGKNLILRKKPYPKDAAEISGILRDAKELLENTAYVGTSGQPSGISSQDLKKAISAIGSLPFIIGVLSFLWSNLYQVFNENGLMLFSLRYSVPALLCFLGMLFFLFNGRSFFRRLFLPAFFFALIGFPMLGFNTAKLLNIKLDRGEKNYRIAAVMNRREIHGKSRAFYVYLDPWKKGSASFKIKVSRRVFNEAIPGETVAFLETKPGKFGFEWLERGQIIPKEKLDAWIRKNKNDFVSSSVRLPQGIQQ